MFNIGNEVEFTDACPRGWWFGPHTEHKKGIILGRSSLPSFKFIIKIDKISHSVSSIGYVNDEHIRLLSKIIDYDELQNGDTEDDI